MTLSIRALRSSTPSISFRMPGTPRVLSACAEKTPGKPCSASTKRPPSSTMNGGSTFPIRTSHVAREISSSVSAWISTGFASCGTTSMPSGRSASVASWTLPLLPVTNVNRTSSPPISPAPHDLGQLLLDRLRAARLAVAGQRVLHRALQVRVRGLQRLHQDVQVGRLVLVLRVEVREAEVEQRDGIALDQHVASREVAVREAPRV